MKRVYWGGILNESTIFAFLTIEEHNAVLVKILEICLEKKSEMYSNSLASEIITFAMDNLSTLKRHNYEQPSMIFKTRKTTPITPYNLTTTRQT